ncbi:DEKNAAC104270 [Brettanomyces naardenensis]|uniref:DEKNAAC104270 n=1 Tax=Brettanomyces naardenensis TaxID=13370 RepID=A0A448YPW0_BRENA|nr:DEKNAAC104270 [Brettanomyces naardenensis]
MANQPKLPPPQQVRSQPVQAQPFQPGHKVANSLDLARQYERDIYQIDKFLFRERDEQGRRLENYIAHVRVVEDSRSPNQRPPENSPAINKKSRYLILTVKISGRMRLHKARENPDGLIQIGRTWDFDQLSAIELDPEVPTGFLFVMGKRYYWETHSPKERRVWVGTVLEHYIKYTNGGVPELVNSSVEYFHLEKLLASLRGNGGNWNGAADAAAASPSPAIPIQAVAKSSTQDTDATVYSQSSTPSNTHPASLPVQKTPKTPSSRPSLHFGHSRNASVTSHEEGKHKSRGMLSPFRRKSSSKKKKESEQDELIREQSERTTAQKERADQLRRQVQQEKDRQMNALRSRQAQEEKMRLEAGRMQLAAEKIHQETERKRQLQQESQRQAELEKAREEEREKLGSKHVAQPPDEENSNELEREKSIASSIEFVGHRKNLDEIEKITESDLKGDASNDYDDFLEDYADDESLDEPSEPHTAPLRLSVAVGEHNGDLSLTRSIDDTLQNSNYKSIDSSADLPDDIKKLVAPAGGFNDSGISDASEGEIGEKPLQLLVPSKKATAVPDESRPHARSRAFSRVEEEKKDNDFSDLFEEIGYDPMKDDYASLERKLLKELERLQSDKINALTQATDVGSALKSSVENALQQCAKIDTGLSFFGVQLSGFKDNVDYIEKQGHGLQVETTNKKLLKKELNEILYSVDVSDDKLRYLLKSEITLTGNNTKIEGILKELYSSLMKMKGSTSKEDRSSQLSSMKALREKRMKLDDVSHSFAANVKRDVARVFKSTSLSLTSKLQSVSVSDDFMSTFFRPVLLKKLSSLLALGGLIAFVKQISEDDYNEIVAIFTSTFHDFYCNFGERVLSQFDYQLRQISFSKFSFNSPPRDFILDDSCKSKVSGTSARSKKPGNRILEELGLASNESSENGDSVDGGKTQDFATNAILEILLEIYLNVMSLQQEVSTEIFSLSSSLGSQFESIVKVPINDRVQQFASREDFLGGSVETDREISDSVYELMKTLFGTSTNGLFRSLSDVAKQNILQPPSILVLLQNMSLKVASTNQEYIYSRFTKLESRIRTIWERQTEDQVQEISTTEVLCRVMNFSKAFPVYFRNVEHNLSSFKLHHVEELQVHQKLISSSEFIWGIINQTLIKGSSSNHLTLLLNYKWLVDQMKDLVLVPSSIKTQVDELRSNEMGSYTEQLAGKHEIGELTRFVDGLEGLIKSNTDPSKTNSYSRENLEKLLGKFKGNNLKLTIKSLAADLQGELAGKCFSESSELENIYSLSLGREIEKDLFNNCLNSLAIAYTSTFSKLNPILKQYYEGVTSPVDKIVINYNFGKEQS